MKSNNFITAPQVYDTDACFEEWKKNHTGSYNAFFKFMTTPSLERNAFLVSLGKNVVSEFVGSAVAIIIKN